MARQEKRTSYLVLWQNVVINGLERRMFLGQFNDIHWWFRRSYLVSSECWSPKSVIKVVCHRKDKMTTMNTTYVGFNHFLWTRTWDMYGSYGCKDRGRTWTSRISIKTKVDVEWQSWEVNEINKVRHHFSETRTACQDEVLSEGAFCVMFSSGLHTKIIQHMRNLYIRLSMVETSLRADILSDWDWSVPGKCQEVCCFILWIINLDFVTVIASTIMPGKWLQLDLIFVWNNSRKLFRLLPLSFQSLRQLSQRFFWTLLSLLAE